MDAQNLYSDREPQDAIYHQQPSHDELKPPSNVPSMTNEDSMSSNASVPRQDLAPPQKLAKFLKTLCSLSTKSSSNHPPGTPETVQNLVQDVIAGRIPPEGFTLNIQKVLGSQAQPRLVPFLKGTLPAFRQALLDGSVVFEEINLEACAGPEFQLIKKVHVPHSSASVSFQNNNKPMSSTGPIYSEPQTSMHIDPQGTHIMYSSVPQPIQVQATSSFVHENNNDSASPESLQQPSEARPNLPDNLVFEPQTIYNRIAEHMGTRPFSGIDDSVYSKLSDLVESRLRDLLKQLSSIAEHRLEPLRMNPLYTQTNEPRRQLRFLEDMDKQAYTRRQNIEKEAWLKYSKSKTKDKDTVQKAKEIQKANQEENLNREANEAAIAALGGTRGTKRTFGGDTLKANAQTNQGIQMHRPRIRRVIMKDFLTALNGRGVQRNNVFKFLVAYGLIEMSEKNNAE